MPLPRLPVKVSAVTDPWVVVAQRDRELAGDLDQDRKNRLAQVNVLVGVQVGGIPAEEAAEGGELTSRLLRHRRRVFRGDHTS